MAIGINFAVHGPKSVETFRAILPEAVAALRALQSKYEVRFHYFMHCDTEQIAVEMLQARGIRIERIVAGSPAELSAGYADMDIVICQMLHAAILAMANETPALCLAYDTKNFIFYDLVGCRDLCVRPDAVTSAGIVESAERMLRRRNEIVAVLRLRREELRANTEHFEQALRRFVLEQQNESNATEPALSALK